ncbi:hypothetical protein GCM10022377_07600 [Zhihengliuella alba]|uniref:Heavy metal transporter n=1 Tax=Zhihengliuella alba TaxID=547018 RepID=A0ABP7CZP9_9MICC
MILGVAVLVAGVVAAVNWATDSRQFVRERCTAVVPDPERPGEMLNQSLAPDQAANAALVAGTSVRRGMQARAATIGLATAMQESKLRNIDYGDEAGPDSRGLFQQRPSQGWGTQAQVMDPVYAANRFFQELATFDYASMRVTQAAQRVQRSAFPEAYAQHEPMARAFASALTGHSPGALTCTLRPAEGAGDAQAVAGALDAHLGLAATAEPGRVVVPATGREAWVVAHWAVAQAAAEHIVAVQADGRVWERATGQWVAVGDAGSTAVAGRAPEAPADAVVITLATDD